MKKPHNPPDLMPPVGPLSWGIEMPQAKRLLFVSGQVGAYPNGDVPEGFIAQTKLVWANIDAILKSANMTPKNIVRTGLYFTPQVEFTGELKLEFNKLRAAFLGDPPPASTLLFVHSLMDPRWLVEIDAIAVETV
jgi:2-iminobutanoate/2-iminopropanoate deaminase